MIPTEFRALLVSEAPDGGFPREIVQRKLTDLPEHGVLIAVHYSSLNYKDALSATGHKGVSRHYPHTPGIDAAGIVVESADARYAPGQEVLVTGYGLGMNTPGGFSAYIRVPGDWVVPKPQGLSLQQSMVLGTAGFTAGIALFKMEMTGQTPEMGPVLVTGASGGVGSLAVAILNQAGYEVVASTGKQEAHEFLRELGASQVLSREDVDDTSGRPLLRPQWGGAIDTVGGNTLATALKACSRNGSVVACGLVASPDLQTTVYPFILNGVNLLGADSAEFPMDQRREVWRRLSEAWSVAQHFDRLTTLCTLEELNETYIPLILQGKTQGRIVVKIN